MQKPHVSLDKSMVMRTVREYILISVGLLMYAFAWMGILLPADIVGGGISGVGMLLYFSLGIPVAYTLFAINGALLIVAALMIGLRFSTKTIYAIGFMAFAMGFMQEIVPPELLGLSGDKFLSAILGGLVSGFGICICFTQGGSTGGTDIIAMIINKYKSISYGKVIMFADFIIIGVSFFINWDITTVIYSYIVVTVGGYAIDTGLAGHKQSSQFMIVSQHYEEIATRVGSEIGRGVTVLNGQGWYSKQAVTMLMVTCRKNEQSLLLRIVKECDTHAFITVSSVMGVYGLGFEPLKK